MSYYLSLPVTDDIALVQPTLNMSEAIFSLLDSDRQHLGTFLDFVDLTNKLEDETAYLKMKLTGVANGTDYLFLIHYKGQLAGTIDLHFIDTKNKKAEIGYWIHSSFANLGITTLAVHKVCEFGFDHLGLNKLTIVADTENQPSNKVAIKSGFTLISTEKEDVFIHGAFRDMNRYSLLKSNFKAKK